MVEMIFASDEMNLIQPESHWTRDELLQKKGMFFLKDISRLLGIDSIEIKKRARALREINKSAYKVMGAKKVWNHWVIRMGTFAPYYHRSLKPLQPVGEDWSLEILLTKKVSFCFPRSARWCLSRITSYVTKQRNGWARKI